ncbi:unnamed protein product [Penicillium salamii]|uniref:Ubiquitin-like protease family profile domain-containing protein n=1 Tax=Penicillium salamii TaxID=1612424 RepID=A0A9W4JGU0_9EURO|nr:unnamed protein product [Penicillium salamii]CAG8139387.1 unnamed protein product [Penicillium salamii]CAG8144321.1 unnamed protein product [Penicillium salamii]CAG8160791.1 unnamed protein product [Penicillium salamii]CAG8167258.1 unnamed protein product [Penicillium salamii]
MNPPHQPISMHLTTSTSHRTSPSTQMVNKNSQDRQDEARLLGGSYYKDPQAVKIKAGATMPPKTKPGKPGASYSFSPSDKITSKSRTSPPARARTKPKDQASGMRRNPTLPEDPFEESSRPNKKQRQGDGSGFRSTATADATVDHSRQGAMSRSVQNPKAKQRLNTGPLHFADEQKEVENGISTSPSRRRTHVNQSTVVKNPDEEFTGKAAQQRRDILKKADSQAPKTNGKRKGTDHPITMDRVEIPTKKSQRDTTAASYLSRYSFNGRESPDELQGDITTHPRKSTTGKSAKTTRSRPLKSEPQLELVTQKRSSSDIQPTVFTSPPQGNKKNKRSYAKLPKKPLKASYYLIGSFTKQCSDGDSVPIYVTDDGFELRADSLGLDQTLKIPSDRITHLYYSHGMTQTKVTLMVSQYNNDSDQIFDLEFCKKEALSSMALFHHLLDPHNVPFDKKDEVEMNAEFASHTKKSEHVASQTLMSLHGDNSDVVPAKQRQRCKLSGQLRLADGELSIAKGTRSERIKIPGNGTGKPRNASPDLGKSLKSILDDQKLQSTAKDAANEFEIPVEPLEPTGRGTRSRTCREVPRAYHRATNGCGPANKDQISGLLENDSFREHWKQPLVYPPNGKKKAEVNIEDRDRLREDTYLNDNLIAFYMRFLQDNLERTNPDAAKRVYFFNSYFFATLRPQGTSEFNYKGVEKWTRNVDLFAYDYILVPINEHQHWYVAIICNLPGLSLEDAEPVDSEESAQTSSETKKTETPHSVDVQKIDETPEPESESESQNSAEPTVERHAKTSSEPPRENHVRRHRASSSAEEQAPAADDTKRPERKAHLPSSDGDSDADENPTLGANLSKVAAQQLAQDETAASQSANSSGKKKRAGPKLSPNQPTIITFDSLDVSRSPTIKVLRDYISAEAKGKRGMQIKTNDIKGMRGREIPLQPNFSDCGLYLLAYLEKFTQSPDWFIAKVLQRGMDSDIDWPPLGSGLLRYRLRTFLDDLYKEQILTTRGHNEPIMADRLPITFLLGPPMPRQRNIPTDEAVPQSRQEAQQEVDPSPTTPRAESTPVESGTPKTTEDHGHDAVGDQLHMASMGTPRALNSKNPSARKSENHRTSTKKRPIIQVPGSLEELDDHTPSPAEARRKRQNMRGL